MATGRTTGMLTLAIDLGGTTAKLALMENGVVRETERVAAHADAGLRPLLTPIARVADAWLRRYPARIDGISIAYPGLVDADAGRVLGSNAKYADAMDFDVRGWFADRYGLRTTLDNDASAALLGEAEYGCARGVQDAVLLILGTGIGSAAMMNGALVRGRHWQAGCLFGHMPLNPAGRFCPGCGATGCAEAQSSTWALPQIVASIAGDSPLKHEPLVDFAALRAYVARGDAVAAAALRECVTYWARCVIALIYAYDPEVVVLSGGVLQWGDTLAGMIAAEVRRGAYTPWGQAEFRVARDAAQSVLMGLDARNARGRAH